MNIQMVDLKGQYKNIKTDIDKAILKCVENANYINGPEVAEFQKNLEKYLSVNHVITCANGTDALQIALMALDLSPDDEVICPAFTYVATAEVIGLLGLKPVMVDVNPDDFCIDVSQIEEKITDKTRAIVPVHLYGQSCDMDSIMNIAKKHNLYVIEDNAQALGADFIHIDGRKSKTGTIGHIGCTSFFPSKNLGCYGDGGAMMTNDEVLAAKLKMIANHGQEKKYYHKVLGCNSRLDTLQAAILDIKLKHLDEYSANRQKMASYYDDALSTIDEIVIPYRSANSTHVFHQYTLKVKNNRRDALKEYLHSKNIPSMIYYPLPLYKQEAFSHYVDEAFKLEKTEELVNEVLSLPIHTEFNVEHSDFIIQEIKNFFKK